MGLTGQKSPNISWREFAFENLCFRHVKQIKAALGISGVKTNQSAWVKRDNIEGTQVDMLISRADHVVNMCEIKYYSDEFEIDKAYYRTLLHRQEMLQKELGKKQVVLSNLNNCLRNAQKQFLSIGKCVNSSAGRK